MSIRKIIYVSGTRADYGLMRETLKKLASASEIDLAICVTGMHLSPVYGNTIDEIRNDGFKVCGSILTDVENTTHSVMAKSIGQTIIGLTDIFAKERPDIVLLLGDRGEMLAAAITAVHLNIPLVHIHGGERSGTVDEMVRHAISKLAHYHFVATEASSQRLLAMGEVKESIFVVGAPGLDEIKLHNPCTREEFLNYYQLDPQKKIALLIYHPVVQEYDELKQQFNNAIKAVLALDLQLICLQPNSDAGGQLIREELARYATNPNILIHTHLLRKNYIDCLAHVDIMLGNSSSGIIEAASFNLPVVNIGTRQNLRERSNNVFDVQTDFEAIKEGLMKALRQDNTQYINCYGDGNTSERCYQLLKNINLNKQILNKCNAY
ncbi:UDP-N-acetylglucosamine 2-epimerase [Legionella sp. km772]|uniref:UDP-N-acetylglucosamine 2-epimerase n=1 Tax=Legionella sp. km772 TaxID=2498111 RepID=UPI000F8E5E1B|nr:UDP-N-acetylglucosamine 2-epimerase [Legionella sp. km772]RUR12118.1 UDP-N-acetylglucosamine 2-epimerase (hydrolyzing) [Legionella sp. km772]